MNSGYERKSQKEHEEQARRQMNMAFFVQPCVAVTETNWAAMIALQKTQTDMLSEIMDAQTELMTKSDMAHMLLEQNQTLMRYTEASKTATENFQSTMKQNADSAVLQIENTVRDLERLAGRMSESFSQSLSAAERNLKKRLRTAF